MDEQLSTLEAEFCPPLDPALLSAIVSDFDLSRTNELEDARKILDELKESAHLEEAAGFDPAGTGATNNASDEGVESCPDTSFSLSKDTDSTSLSAGLSSLDLEENCVDTGLDASTGQDLDTLDEDTKIALLRDIFGSKVSNYSIQHTLRKCQGRWQPTLEELLNHVFFHEGDATGGDKIAAKGVDAFAEGSDAKRGRRHRAKPKRLQYLDESRSSSLPAASDSDSPAPQNRWLASADEIEFIAQRMRIPPKTVSSFYYANGASMPQTIASVIKASADQSKHIVDDDASIDITIHDLCESYPSIPPSSVATIVRLTHPSTVSAREIASALVARPEKANLGGIQIIPRYAPVSQRLLDEANAADTSSIVSSSTTPLGADAADRATTYAAMKSTAYAQARSAYRRAKSDRLMGGAAAYYSEVARDNAALQSTASAAAADQMAAAQSSSNQLDLHGIDVLNGIRIAQERVEQWWAGLGESRVNGRIGKDERQAGYQIVVGLGRHSSGGQSKLGPAVSKMLRDNGWKIEMTGASIIVRGQTKR